MLSFYFSFSLSLLFPHIHSFCFAKLNKSWGRISWPWAPAAVRAGPWKSHRTAHSPRSLATLCDIHSSSPSLAGRYLTHPVTSVSPSHITPVIQSLPDAKFFICFYLPVPKSIEVSWTVALTNSQVPWPCTLGSLFSPHSLSPCSQPCLKLPQCRYTYQRCLTPRPTFISTLNTWCHWK